MVVRPPGYGRRVARPREIRYQAFIGTGVVVGLIAAGVLALVGTPRGDYSSGAVFGYLAVSCGLLGALVGATVAVVIDAVRQRRRRRT